MRIASTTRAIALIMEAVCISETSVYFCETTRRYIPEGYYFQVTSQVFSLLSINVYVVYIDANAYPFSLCNLNRRLASQPLRYKCSDLSVGEAVLFFVVFHRTDERTVRI